jgi:hypothetical protein
LNADYQGAQRCGANYSASINLGSQGIEGVWASANQYMDHESKTFIETAQARSGYVDALNKFNDVLANDPTNITRLTELGQLAFQNAQALLSVRVQIEAYPELKASTVVQDNMRNIQVAVNTMKTALEDWQTKISDYNTYRGSFWVNIFGGLFPESKFPAKLVYYEGPIKELDMSTLNPANK